MKKTLKFIMIIILIFNLQSCHSQEKSILTISSLDKEQEFSIKIGEIAIYENSILDTSKINDEVAEYDLDVTNIKKYIISSEDCNVFWLTNTKTGNEGEVSIYMFGTFNKNLINLYYVEVEQGKWFWKINNGNFGFENSKVYGISGDLVSMGFALSGLIKFPFNDKGTYSEIKRYLNFKTTFIYENN